MSGALLRSLALLSGALLSLACRTNPTLEPITPEDRVAGGITQAVGDEIIAAGRRFHTGAPVVLWYEEPHYSAYATEARFPRPSTGPGEPDAPHSTGDPGGSKLDPLRYQPGRSITDAELQANVLKSGWTLENLQQVVDQFILHYDVCGTSQVCFRVLHDLRGLSVHFLLDVDGTIYQTLDLKEQAWHARSANPRSIGIEIAQIGAYPVDGPNPFDEWYAAEGARTSLTIPERFDGGGVRTPAYQGHTRRSGMVVADFQGHRYSQFDFTNEQYASLIKLTAALVRIFPRITPDAPRDPSGAVRDAVLTVGEAAAFQGILGHFHVSDAKVDPGPAFQWEYFLQSVQDQLREEPGRVTQP